MGLELLRFNIRHYARLQQVYKLWQFLAQDLLYLQYELSREVKHFK